MAPMVRSTNIPKVDDRGSILLAMYWTECSICIIVVFLRFYSRIKIQSVGLDDWAMLFTLILGLTVAALATLNVSQGGARHLYQIAPSNIMSVLKLNWVLQPFAIMALATAKISVAFVMLRIIPSATVWARRILHFAIVSTFLTSAIASILTFVQCDPPRALWEFGVKGAKCWDPRVQSDYAIFSSFWNSFIDIGLALLPIPIIWKLQMRVRKKLGICGLLGLGILAGISSTVKATKLRALRHRSDLTWATFDLFSWTAAELFCLVICGSIPTLKPVYDLLFSRKKKISGPVGSKTLVIPRNPTMEKPFTEEILTKQITQISSTTPHNWPLTSGSSPVSPSSSVHSYSSSAVSDDGGNVDELLSSIRAAVAAEQLRMEEDLRVHGSHCEDAGGGDVGGRDQLSSG